MNHVLISCCFPLKSFKTRGVKEVLGADGSRGTARGGLRRSGLAGAAGHTAKAHLSGGRARGGQHRLRLRGAWKMGEMGDIDGEFMKNKKT